jgi:Homing endonuclease associated repeat
VTPLDLDDLYWRLDRATQDLADLTATLTNLFPRGSWGEASGIGVEARALHRTFDEIVRDLQTELLRLAAQPKRRNRSEAALARGRQKSVEAKRKRTGSCVTCGAETKYNGHSNVPTHPNGASLRCLRCNNGAQAVWSREKIIRAMQAWVVMEGRPPSASDWAVPAGRPVPATATVQAHFGSWSEGLRQAGLQGHPSSGKRTPEQRARMSEAQRARWAKTRQANVQQV